MNVNQVFSLKMTYINLNYAVMQILVNTICYRIEKLFTDSKSLLCKYLYLSIKYVASL